MGNTIFRYFLEWLRQEMREEAYAKYITQTERRARARKQTQESMGDEGGGWSSYSFSSQLDEWWNAYFADSTSENENRKKQLWELAQIEGDEKYVEWLENHIWTYVGLSAPVSVTGRPPYLVLLLLSSKLTISRFRSPITNVVIVIVVALVLLFVVQNLPFFLFFRYWVPSIQ